MQGLFVRVWFAGAGGTQIFIVIVVPRPFWSACHRFTFMQPRLCEIGYGRIARDLRDPGKTYAHTCVYIHIYIHYIHKHVCMEMDV